MFTYKGQDYEVVYVDPTIVVPGDGSTPAVAMIDIPDLPDIIDKTCYLIRRTAEAVGCSQKESQSTSMDYIMFLGMPLVGDSFYNLVPAEAKAAWDADADTHAVFHRISNTYAYFYNFELITIRNIKFLQTGGTFTAHMWYFEDQAGATLLSELDVSNCIFSSLDHGRMKDLVSDLPRENYGPFFQVYTCGTLNISDCEWDSGYSVCINNIHARWINISNVESWHFTGAGQWFYTENRTAYGHFYSFRDIKIHVIVNGNNTGSETLPGIIFLNTSPPKGEMLNVEVDMDLPVLGTFTKRLTAPNHLVYWHCSESLVENLYIDYSKCWYKLSNNNYSMCYFSTGGMDAQQGDHNHIYRNLTIKLASTGGLGDPDTKATASPSYYDSLLTIHGVNSRTTAENITVSHPRGRAISLAGVNFNNMTIDGSIYLRRACSGNINHFGSHYVSDMLHAFEASRVYFENIVMNKNNPDDLYIGDSVMQSETVDGSYILVNNTNVPLFASQISSGGDEAYLTNWTSFNDVESGNFRFRSTRHLIETWNVERDGNQVLKMTCLDSTNRWPLVIGRTPNYGVKLTPASIGVQELHMYIATKNLLNVAKLNQDFKIMVHVPMDADPNIDSKKTINTQLHGYWEEDTTSVYANDSGLTQMVFKVPVNIVTLTKDLEFQIFWNHYSSNGYLYLDPKFVLA